LATLKIRLTDELREDLLEISRTESRPISEIVRDSLSRYVALQQFRAIRRRILPFAEAQGLVTDEETFRILR
jgi:predicted transcriptional regulator